MSILIKGIQMPKEDELLCIRIYPSGKVTLEMDLQCKQVAEAVELHDHGDLFDKDELSELIGESFEYFLARLSLKCPKAIIPAERSKE